MSKKILIVEDASALRDLLEALVKLCGYETLIAENGERAYELYMTEKPDAIISDVRMPKMDGLTLLQKIRENDVTIKIILITSFSEALDTYQAYRAGADDFLLKPFIFDDLKEALRKTLSPVGAPSF